MSKIKIGTINNSNIVTGDITGDVVYKNTQIIGDEENIKDIAVEIDSVLTSSAAAMSHSEVANNVVQHINDNKSFSEKISKSVKDGSIDALSQFLNHPAASFLIGAIKSWKEQKNS